MLSDLRHAARSLLKSRGFLAVALLTLALGIGVNTAMFSLVNTLLFKAAPFPEATRLVRIFRTSPQSQTWPHSAADLSDLRRDNKSLEKLTMFSWATFSFAEPGQPAERVPGLSVDADFFPTLRVQPALGRSFTPEEMLPGHDQVIVLSHALWERRFNADPAILGQVARIDGQNVTIIGVMPEGVDYPLLWGRVDAWRPLALSAEQLKNRGNHWINALGRLKPGASLGQARTEFNAIATRWAHDFAETNEGTGLRLVLLHQSTMDEIGRSLSMLVMGLSGFVLLIACANLANLQLARTAQRARDYAIRAALGASRSRLMRELLVESLALSLVGGLLGFILATWLTDALGRRILIGENSGLDISIDFSVLAFTLVASLATGLLFGLLPAWQAGRTDVNAALKQQARGSTGTRAQHRVRHALIVGEVALALALLAGAGYFLRGLQRFTHQDNGWAEDHVITATLSLPKSKYETDAQRIAFYDRALARLGSLPGVEHAALASSLPIWGYNSSRDMVPADRPLPPASQVPLVYAISVSPDFFAVLKVPLLEGRLFPAQVSPDGPKLVVVNEALAKQFWPGQSAVGKQLGRADADDKRRYEVIGVVRDVGFAGNPSAPDTRLQVYAPLVQEPWSFLSIALRTTAAPGTLAPALRTAIADIDPDLPAYNIRTVEQSLERLSRNFRLTNQLLTGFALLGLLLAAIGLYGVIAGLVVQRTSEFGIRLALGAQPASVLWLVLRKGLRLALLGTVVGLAGTFGLVRLFAALIPGLPGQDWLLIAGTALALLAVTLFACWLPARRATKVDPLVALRAE
jgi:predicted permease